MFAALFKCGEPTQTIQTCEHIVLCSYFQEHCNRYRKKQVLVEDCKRSLCCLLAKL